MMMNSLCIQKAAHEIERISCRKKIKLYISKLGWAAQKNILLQWGVYWTMYRDYAIICFQIYNRKL